MIAVRNSLEMTEEAREAAVRCALRLGLCPGKGCDAQDLLHAVGAARPGSLPQFLFLEVDGRLRGYCFCIAEREQYSPVLPWWAVHNADELPGEWARPLLDAGANLCAACGAAVLCRRLRAEEAGRT